MEILLLLFSQEVNMVILVPENHEVLIYSDQ
jgi:hypothetical protein